MVSDALGTLLRNGIQDRKGDAIMTVMGTRLYLAVSLADDTYLDTIFVHDLRTGTWDRWDTFRIVDMVTVVLPTGRQLLYVETRVGTGYAVYAFSSGAYNDGRGAQDFSGTVTAATANTVTIDTTLPTSGLALMGMRVAVETGSREPETAWCLSNTTDTITIEGTWDTLPQVGDTITVGAIDVELLSGMIGIPEGHTEQSVKHSEWELGRMP